MDKWGGAVPGHTPRWDARNRSPALSPPLPPDRPSSSPSETLPAPAQRPVAAGSPATASWVADRREARRPRMEFQNQASPVDPQPADSPRVCLCFPPGPPATLFSHGKTWDCPPWLSHLGNPTRPVPRAPRPLPAPLLLRADCRWLGGRLERVSGDPRGLRWSRSQMYYSCAHPSQGAPVRARALTLRRGCSSAPPKWVGETGPSPLSAPRVGRGGGDPVLAASGPRRTRTRQLPPSSPVGAAGAETGSPGRMESTSSARISAPPGLRCAQMPLGGLRQPQRRAAAGPR